MAQLAAEVDDHESRKFLNTRTVGHGVWDQVLGISQRIVNKSFQTLFEKNPEMGVMYKSVADVGYIDAKLECPEIIIPGANMKSMSSDQIIFLLKFKEGKMQSASGQTQISKLGNWQLAIPVNIGWESVVTEGDIDDVTLTVNQAIRAKFDNPNNYGIDKLYMALSTMNFSTLNPELTVCGKTKDGRPISVSEYEKTHPDFLMQLNNWMQNWSMTQERQGFNIIGLAFNLSKENSRTPTFSPTLRRHQAYPYKSRPQGCPDGATAAGISGPAACNALLYNEMVDKHPPPDDTAINWCGNFATLAGSPDGSEAYDGTYVLNRKVLFGAILEDIRNLIYSANLMHCKGPAAAESEEYWPLYNYQMGGDPVLPREAPEWNFVDLNPDDDPAKESGYRWHRVHNQDHISTSHPGGNWAKALAHDDLVYDLKWIEGTCRLRLSALCNYYEDLRQTTQWPPNYEEGGVWGLLWYKFQVKWSFDILFVPERTADGQDTILIMLDTHHGDYNLQITCNRKSIGIGAHTEIERIQFVRDMMKGPLHWNVDSVMKYHIGDKFREAGRFVYPGTGCLSFRNPIFTKYGNLVAGVGYKPITKQIVVPKPLDKRDWPSTDGKKYDNIIDNPEPKFHLDWTVTSKVGPAMKRNRIVLRATNNTKDGWALFKEIRVRWVSYRDQGTLFFVDKWQLASTPAPKDMPADKPVIAPVPSTDKSAADKPASDKPVGDKPATDKPTDDKPAIDKPADAKSAIDKPADAKPATDKPADVHSATEGPGLVYLNQSVENDGANIAVATLNYTDPEEWTWQVTVKGAQGQLAVGPGRYIELVLEGKLGGASTANSVEVDEDWADARAKNDSTFTPGHFRGSFDVEITKSESILGRLFDLVTGK